MSNIDELARMSVPELVRFRERNPSALVTLIMTHEDHTSAYVGLGTFRDTMFLNNPDYPGEPVALHLTDDLALAYLRFGC